MVTLKPLGCLGTPRDSGLKLLEEASEACEALKEYGKAIEREQAAPPHALEGTMELAVDWRCPTDEDEGEDDHGSDD